MSEKFIKNAFVLSIGIFISKFLGFIFVIPFSYMIGKEGLALYSYAYVPYSLFIDLATLGIPMGFSKFVSIRSAVGEDAYLTYAIKRLKRVMLMLGILCALLMILVAPYYASLVNGETFTHAQVTLVIRIVALALIFIPLLSLYRGYFQGLRIMLFSTISQILEQVVRVAVILLGTYIVLRFTDKVEYAVYIAVSGALFGGVSALIYIFLKFKKEKLKPAERKDGLLFEIFKYSIPFVIYGSSFTLYNLIDSVMFNKVIKNDVIYGIYSFEIQKIVFIPISIVAAVSSALLPSIVRDYKLSNIKELKRNLSKALGLVLLVTLPLSLFIFFFSDFSYNFVFKNNYYGPIILKYYMPISILISISSLSMSVLQGIDKGKVLIVSILLGVFTKAMLNYYLLTQIGYLGALTATYLGYFVTVFINVIFIVKALKKHEKEIVV